VTGADFSPDLLNQARNKAVREKLDINFIDGDMRSLQVGSFDAVITIDNAIGHLTKVDFEQAMCNIHKNLKDGGLYLFDILNLEAMTDEVVANLSWHLHKKINDSQVHVVQCQTIDRQNGYLTSYDNYTIQKNAEKPEMFSNIFSLKIYTAKELQEMLSSNGFDVIDQLSMDGSAFVNDKTISMLTVAKKK
jgi:ubiquinone/menaquinone biosynthesis C-methylase UbiE